MTVAKIDTHEWVVTAARATRDTGTDHFSATVERRMGRSDYLVAMSQTSVVAPYGSKRMTQVAKNYVEATKVGSEFLSTLEFPR